MARRRRDDDKRPDLPFEVPAFDESEYIRRETISFRTTLILFVYSIATAAASFGAWLAAGATPRAWLLALVVGGVLGYLLKYIYPALKVDISHFGKKEWTGTGFLYFFSWLAFFIFLTNPPIYDGVAPDVGLHITPDLQTTGQPVNVTVFATDNTGVDPDTLVFSVQGPGGGALATEDDLWQYPDHDNGWAWSFAPDAPGTYTVTASVTDTRGRTSEATATFRVGDVIDVQLDKEGRFTSDIDRVIVRLPERPAGLDIWQVRLVPTTDTVPIVLTHDREKDLWQVDAAHIGFRDATAASGDLNVTFRVEVVEHDSYALARDHGLRPIETHLTSGPHNVTFADPDVLGDSTTKTPRKVPPIARQVPGADALLTVAAAVALLAGVARARPGRR